MRIAVVGAGGTGGYFGGQRLELENLKGEVVRREREHGVSRCRSTSPSAQRCGRKSTVRRRCRDL